MAGYYDIILGLIPIALTGITGILLVVGLALSTAVFIGSFVALGLILHAMFVRTPGRTATPDAPARDGSYNPAD